MKSALGKGDAGDTSTPAQKNGKRRKIPAIPIRRWGKHLRHHPHHQHLTVSGGMGPMTVVKFIPRREDMPPQPSRTAAKLQFQKIRISLSGSLLSAIA
jgi:hypothetical protein